MDKQITTAVVWVSEVFVNSLVVKGPIDDWSQNTTEPPYDVASRIQKGHVVPKGDLPKRFASAPGDRKIKTAGHVFLGGGFLCVSGDCATILERFDLGSTSLVPVEVVNHDNSPIAGDYRVMNIGERKRVLAPEACTDKVIQPYGPEQEVWKLKLSGGDDDVAVHRSALEGADLWVDPLMRTRLFFSDPLVQALRDASMDEPFRFKRCRVV